MEKNFLKKLVKSLRFRVAVIVFLALIACSFIVYKLCELTLVDADSLRQAAVNQQLKDTTITAKRGNIYDINGKVLATSASVYRLFFDTVELNKTTNVDSKKTLIASELAPILEVDEQELLNLLARDGYYIVVRSNIETETKDKIVELRQKLATNSNTALRVSGVIRLESVARRYYPYGTLASTVLGFTGSDGYGLEGLEAYYDSELTGQNGKIISSMAAGGYDMPYSSNQEVKARDGYSLVLTIDESVQQTLEKYLDEGVKVSDVVGRATGIIMNVKTGAILAMAVSGDYNPNNPFAIDDETVALQLEQIEDEEKRAEALVQARQQQWRNKAVSDTYYPGSVFKMITLAMALEENLVTENTSFNCIGYTVPFEGEEPIYCWNTYGHGWQTIVEGTMNSCNPLYMELGKRLGATRFMSYFESFGFADTTGVDLLGESPSIYLNAESMGPVDLAVYSFGQNFSVTPIQMITACCAIANGGKLVQPHVVDRILDSDGNIVKTVDTSIKRQVISEDTSRRVSEILRRNGYEGTAKNGYVMGYRIAGKTGTSQKIADYNYRLWQAREKLNEAYAFEVDNSSWDSINHRNELVAEAQKELNEVKMRYIASYCGFAPADDPEIALLMLFDEPMSSNYYGSSVAGPYFAKVMNEVLPYLGIEPQYTKTELSQLDGVAPNVLGQSVSEAKNTVQNAGLSSRVLGDGDTVISQVPSAQAIVPKGGFVAFYTDEDSLKEHVSVPNLTGLTRSQVLSTARNSGIQIVMTGAGYTGGAVLSSSQSVETGVQVLEGTVISVNFIEVDQVA